MLRLLLNMPNYRRVFVPGGSYFFTVNLLDRTSRLLVEHIESLRTAVRATRQRFPFEMALFAKNVAPYPSASAMQ